MQLDTAILQALNLSSSQTTAATHGSSGFSTTAKITTNLPNGTQKTYFMKTGAGPDADTMFAGEHASLNALHNSVPTLCPQSFAHGRLSTGKGAFLVTDFLDLRPGAASNDGKGSGLSLAAKLAKLHMTPAPVPEGWEGKVFGFAVPTCCGSTVQENEWSGSWAEFYAERRLLFILRQAEKHNGKDPSLRGMVERTAKEVVPRLIGDDHLNNGRGVQAVVVHGDLWSGNKGRGVIGQDGAVEEVVFDPSTCYAHSEYELGIMRMFGGFGMAFLKEYHAICPKSEPVDEYDDRVSLYELYHHLNHFSLFGGGYRGGAISIMNSLLTKYGDKSEL